MKQRWLSIRIARKRTFGGLEETGHALFGSPHGGRVEIPPGAEIRFRRVDHGESPLLSTMKLCPVDKQLRSL